MDLYADNNQQNICVKDPCCKPISKMQKNPPVIRWELLAVGIPGLRMNELLPQMIPVNFPLLQNDHSLLSQRKSDKVVDLDNQQHINENPLAIVTQDPNLSKSRNPDLILNKFKRDLKKLQEIQPENMNLENLWDLV